MSVLATSHLALILSLFVVLGLWGLGELVSRKRRPELSIVVACFLTVLLSTILQLRSWITSLWVEVLVLVILGCGVGYFAFNKVMAARRNWQSVREFLYDPLCLLLVFLIYFQWLWASLPLYRYDTWTYHLVIAKWVDLLGSLKGPAAIDSVFYTGGYEFWGLLARIFWKNDAFQQGFQGALTSMIVGVTAFRIAYVEFMRSKANAHDVVRISLAFALAVIFSTGDQAALSSAKPDFALMAFSLVVLWALLRQQAPSDKRPLFALGLLMGASVSFKLTWIHIMLGVLPLAIWRSWLAERWNGVMKLIIGGITGSVLVTPFLVKNYLFFANPLHPAQTSFWTSNIWSPGLAEYWHEVLGKPESLPEFLINLGQICLSLPQRMIGSLCAIVVIILFSRLGRVGESKSRVNSIPLAPLMVFSGLYLVSWGLFFRYDIAHRFVFGPPVIGSLILLALIINAKMRTWLLCVSLMLPALVVGELDVNARQILAAFGRDTMSYHESLGKGPALANSTLHFIGKHKESAGFSSKDYDKGAIFSDHILNFYGPSVFYHAPSPITKTIMELSGVDPEVGCARDFVLARDIRYFWLLDSETYDEWPRSIRDVISHATEITAPQGRLWYLADPASVPCDP